MNGMSQRHKDRAEQIKKKMVACAEEACQRYISDSPGAQEALV